MWSTTLTRYVAHLLRWWCSRLRSEPLAWSMAGLCAVLAVSDPRPLSAWLRWLEPASLASLLALLAVAQGVRGSGYVQAFAQRMLSHLRTQRSVAAVLVSLAALISMVLTNDVSLIVLVPLTLSLADSVHLPRQRLVIFEALAVNAGSALSPVGNPQNLLLWKQSGLSMPGFVAVMAPAVAPMVVMLAVATWCAFPGRMLEPHAEQPAVPERRRRRGVISALALAAVLLMMASGAPYLAAGLVLLVYGVTDRWVLRQMDWVLLVTIALMLLGLGHLCHVAVVQNALRRLDGSSPVATVLGGIALSQLISNVPATVALKGFVHDPRWLAMAVNVGGFGVVTGSLANVIALRLEGGRGIYGRFHIWSLPFLLVSTAAVCVLVMLYGTS